jgi:tight adherence protein C
MNVIEILFGLSVVLFIYGAQIMYLASRKSLMPIESVVEAVYGSNLERKRLSFIKKVNLKLVKQYTDRFKSGRKLDQNLLLLKKSKDALSLNCFYAAIIGAGVSMTVFSGLFFLGDLSSFLAPAWIILACAAIGWLIPIAKLNREAQEAREELAACLSLFADLVALHMSSGMGLEESLMRSTEFIDEPSFSHISKCLRFARETGANFWDSLMSLGRRLDVTFLVELASSIKLAGDEGAKIKTSLLTKSKSLKNLELSKAKTKANQITEKLFLPSLVMLFGFLIFIGYPALERIMQGL